MNNQVAVIVVDMVYDFTNPKGRVFYPLNEDLLPKIKKFINEARSLGALIVYMRHSVTTEMLESYTKQTRPNCIEGTGGDEIDKRLDVKSEDLVIKKHKYSSFYETHLKEELEKRNINEIVVIGTKTNNCILATVLDAYNYNIKTYVAKELVGTSDEMTNDIYLRDMGRYLCEVESKDDILQMMEMKNHEL